MPSGAFEAELPRPAERLEREIELGRAAVRLSEWPGRRGPLVCLEWPAAELADLLAPDWRVLQVALRPDLPYQAQAAEAQALLDAFGFERVVVLGHGLAAAVALLLAAWEPRRVTGLVLVSPRDRPRPSDAPAHRAWLDAPLRWRSLLAEVSCPMARISAARPRRVAALIKTFLDSAIQSEAWG